MNDVPQNKHPQMTGRNDKHKEPEKVEDVTLRPLTCPTDRYAQDVHPSATFTGLKKPRTEAAIARRRRYRAKYRSKVRFREKGTEVGRARRKQQRAKYNANLKIRERELGRKLRPTRRGGRSLRGKGALRDLYENLRVIPEEESGEEDAMDGVCLNL